MLDGQEVYAFFVGEAAYYEPSKDIAFMLARKETLAVSLPWALAVGAAHAFIGLADNRARTGPLQRKGICWDDARVAKALIVK